MRTATLRPDAPLSELPRSDTVFGAVCWGIRLSRGEERLEEVLRRFADNEPPFRLSSAYPVIAPEDDDRRTHLLPRPMVPMQSALDTVASDGRLDALKRWERLEYIPESLFDKLVRGTLSPAEILDAFAVPEPTVTIDGTSYLRTEQFLLPDFDYTSPPFQPSNASSRPDERMERHGSEWRPLTDAERMRNAVNRLSNATEGRLFHSRSVHIADGAALHVAVEGDIELALTGLAAIQDHGIGGGKSVGKGTFELGQLGELDVPPADGGPVCTLSLCIPRDEALERALDRGLYDIETRKGVLESSFVDGTDIWKKQVLALTEGSILPRFDGYLGHNPIVADRFEHGVQQFGYELPVGVDSAVHYGQ